LPAGTKYVKVGFKTFGEAFGETIDEEWLSLRTSCFSFDWVNDSAVPPPIEGTEITSAFRADEDGLLRVDAVIASATALSDAAAIIAVYDGAALSGVFVRELQVGAGTEPYEIVTDLAYPADQAVRMYLWRWDGIAPLCPAVPIY
jgi:hypothetical protein